jgi:DNA replication protein DnaC
MNPNQEPTKEQKEAFMRLENEVAAMKKRSHPPEITTYDETRNMRNVVCASEEIADILPILQEKERKWNDFVRQVDWELEKMEPEFCLEHEDVRLVVDRDKTLSGTWFHPEKRITVRYQGCPVCAEALTKSLVNEKWVKMGIPHKVLHATMDNFKTDTDKKQRLFLKVETFLKRGGGFLIFRGEVGTGKSHLGTAIIKDVGEGLFVTELDLLAEFRGTYGGKGDENAVIEKYRTCKVLVLDELSAEVKGVDIAPLLYRVLADRYDKGLLTVITSNEKLDVILDILGARLADRVKHSYYVATFDWESARKSEN